ncbi:MAG: lipid II:glycine glycyltransferase FemX [Armatimonadota bacterium]
MATTEVLSVREEARWAAVLDQIGAYDFCHLPAYSRLAEASGHGRAAMFVYQEGEHLLAFPLLFRPIVQGGDRIEGGPWTDVTSVYGYAGPLATGDQIPEQTARGFMSWVAECFREQRAVSALSRMHPLLPQQSGVLNGLGEISPVGWTLSVDLTAPEEEQTRCYRRNHRQDIRRLTTMGVVCEEVGMERVDEFVDIYYENMDRVRAASEYYFSRDYFRRLFGDMPGVTHLFMCRHEGRAIAASIFTLCSGICQWYLSGSRSDFDGPPPTKLIFDVARRWAGASGAHTLHLGGGVGGSRDSLYHFKRGFTQREHVYSIWKCVVNQPVYDELARLMCEAHGSTPADDYFPRYRHPAFQAARAVGGKAQPAARQTGGDI